MAGLETALATHRAAISQLHDRVGVLLVALDPAVPADAPWPHCPTPLRGGTVTRPREMIEVGSAHRGRGAAEYGGVRGRDCDAASTSYDGRSQDCWAHLLGASAGRICCAHLLRAIDERGEPHPQDAAGRGGVDGVSRLDQRATADPGGPPAHRRPQQQTDAAPLKTLCAPDLGQVAAPPRVRGERITTHLSAPFVFVADPDVPATTTAAEHRRHHLVTMSTSSGGPRSSAGTATLMPLATVVGPWPLHGRHPLVTCAGPSWPNLTAAQLLVGVCDYGSNLAS